MEIISRLCALGYLERGRELEYMDEVSVKKLPWCGVEWSERCENIKRNEGLYTQCEGKRSVGMKCEKCEKSEKSGMRYGRVDERMSVGIMEYRDSEGNGPVAYSKIMKKYGLTKERVLLEGKIVGVEVPEIHFLEEEVGKRGRPRKSKDDVKDDVKDVVVEKKKRGRPRKEKEVENKITGEDLIASLLREKEDEVSPQLYSKKEACMEVKETSNNNNNNNNINNNNNNNNNNNKKPSADNKKKPSADDNKPSADNKKKPSADDKKPSADNKKEPSADTEDKPSADTEDNKKPSADTADTADTADEEEETVVVRFEKDGVVYLKSGENVLYDIESHEAIGVWNEKSGEIEELEEDDE